MRELTSSERGLELCDDDGDAVAMSNGGWTPDQLKAYIDTVMMAHEMLDESRHKCGEEAVRILSNQAHEWRAAANEWRGALNDTRSSYVAKDVADKAHEGLQLQIADLQKQVSEVRGRIGVILIGIPIAVTVALAVIHYSLGR